MTAQEFKEKGQKLLKSGQYAEAISLLKSAAEAFPKDESVWSDLMLAASGNGQHEESVEFAKQGIRQLPRSDWLWRHLGDELTILDRLDEAEKALINSENLNSDAPWLWRYWASLHQKRKAYDKEIKALEKLLALEKPAGNELNRLGIAYHNHGNFAKAVEFYRLAATTDPNTVYFFNMGLVFSHPEVSQDADAADAYRRALALKPDYEPARKGLDTTRQKLAPLAAAARSAANGLIQKSEHFQFYLSPFETLQIAKFDSAETLDVKMIQRAKKLLLHEIKVNDGKVTWLNDYALDVSRALALEDDLLNESKRHFHSAVFENKPLLRFLTRGDIEHFLYSDDYFPQQSLELLDEEPEFRDFLSKSFSNQYNLVLSRAIEQRALPVIETLFDGRRWVNQADEDICFGGAYKRVGDLVQLMRAKATEGEKRKVSVRELEDFLKQHSFSNLFNLLPTAFRSAQSELVAEIRSLAISCNNEHGDTELSAQILGLCKRFNFKSAELTKKLEEDFKAIEGMISEQRQTRKVIAERVAEQQRFGRMISEQQQNESSSKKIAPGWLVFVGILVIFGVFRACDTTNTSSSHTSYTPPSVAPTAPSYTLPVFPNVPVSSYTPTYQVPSVLSAELDRDKQAIENVKAKAERLDIQLAQAKQTVEAQKAEADELESKLKTLGRQIESDRIYLDQTSQSDVDEFNQKVNRYNIMLRNVRAENELVNQVVDSHNALLEQVRTQNRVVNQMVDNYNEKLRKHGR